MVHTLFFDIRIPPADFGFLGPRCTAQLSDLPRARVPETNATAASHTAQAGMSVGLASGRRAGSTGVPVPAYRYRLILLPV